MNKIYKVVWNTVRNCYVVGSELISSKSGRHSTSNGKSSSLKVTLTVLALCGMTALGSSLVPAYAADAGTAVESQYVAVLVNEDNGYYTYGRRKIAYGDTRTFDGYSYHKETVSVSGSSETYWVRDGYTIKYEENERYPGARKDNIIKAYKTDSYTASSDTGLLKSNQIMVESAGISTLTGVDLDDVSGGTYVGATNSGSTSTPSSFNYMIKDDNGTYIDAGGSNYSTHFAAATKNSDGTYSYNGEVLSNDNLYVISSTDYYGNTTNKVGVFLTSSGKVYTGKVFGANNEVLMTTKSAEGTMYSYWGADTPDPNTKLADMTIGQFNQALEKVNNNSKAVAGDTIKEIKTTAKTDGGTIDLVRRGQYNSATGQYEGEHKVGNGITITSRGGTNGEDVKINFSNDNGKTGFDVAAGSKVRAIGTTDATTGLTINGVDYTIKAGKDYKPGTNIQISDDNTISANDNYVTGGSINGDTITLNRLQGGDVTITGLKDYVEGKDSYVTGASLKDNKLTITQNNGKGNYEIDLSGFADQFSGTDYRVVANPAKDSGGIYKPDASGNIELTVQDAKTGAKSTVQLSDIASATTVTNNYTTLDTKIDKTKTDITNAYTTTINETKNTITNEYKKYVSDTEDYVTSGSISNDTITLKRALGGEVTITGLKDYVEGLDSYVTSASLKDNKLTITQNNGKGNYEIDLSGFADQFSGTDYRVVANPAEGSKGIYKPDASGNIALTVEDAKTGTTSTVQLSDVASATTVTNNYNTLNTKIDAAKTHYFSVNSSATGEGSNYNNDGAVGLGSIAVGANAYANGRIGASAFGNRAYADGEKALAVGYGSKAQGLAAIAIGTGSRHGADGTDAIAIGEQSYAKGGYTTAVGGYSQAVADGATAFGQQAVASGSHSTAIGIQSQALGNQSTAVGDYSKTEGTATVAFGGYSKTTGNFATALGYASKSVTRGTAVGAASSVTGETGTALGLLSTASANGSVALGAQSSADIDAGVTGYNPNTVEGEDLTSPTWTSTLGAVSVGAAATVDKDGNPVAQKTRQITNLAAGTADTDAVNVAQLKKSRVELTDGTNTTVNSTNDQTDGHVIYSVDVKTNGTIKQGDTNIVTGDTVYNALQNVSWTANVNGQAAKTVKKDGTLNFVNGDNISISNEKGDIKISTTGLASSGDLWTAQAGGTDVKVVNQKVNFVGSDHITVTGTDGQIQFKATGLADTDFNNITDNAITKIQNIAKGEDVHIKADTYTVGNDGSVTMTYVDGNGNKVDGTAKITGIAKSDLTNITEGGKKVINNLAKEAVKVVSGMNTTVESSTTTDGPVEYKVNLNEDVNLGDTIYLNGSDGSISAKSSGAQLAFNNSGLTVAQAKNGLTNETRIDGATITVDGGAGNQTIINGSTARIGGVLVNGGSGTATISGLTNQTTKYDGFANGGGRAATEEQLSEVAGKASEAIETAGKGWNLTTKKGTATNIAPGGTVDFSSSNDNLLISNAGADLSFSLSDNLDLTKNDSKKGSVKVGENTTLTDGLLRVGTDVSLTASALNVGNSSLTTSALMVGSLTYINSNGLNANNRVISNVAAGILDTDAVNVGQLKSAISGSQVSIKAGDGISVAKTGNQYTINVNIEGVTNNQGKVTVSTGDSTSTENGSESGSSGAKKSQVMDLMYRTESNEVAPETTTDTGKAIQIENIPENIKLEADDNQAASVVNGETIKIAGDGTNISTKATVTGAGSKDTISVSLKPDIQVDSVTINNGGPTINNTGIDMNGKSITNVENITVNNGPTINSSGIDMNSQKITNLADGEIAEGSTDAVNGGQLYNTNQAVIANAENINSLSHSLNKLDSRINRVGAGAAALAALHPLDFDPDNKWDFAAGYGNYAGANAVAIGTYYRPNENTMFSIGGSFGGGENMINAGVSFKLGSGGSGITTSKTVMAKKIKEQDELLKAQDAKMKEQDEKIAKLEALVAQQGEMIQQALGKK